MELEELVQVVQGLLERECELTQQRNAAANAVLDAEKVRRRVDREARNAETRARRAIEGGDREDIISRHIAVDPGAWVALAREARRRRTTLMTLAGRALSAEAVSLEAGDVAGPPSTRWRRSPGEPRPQPEDRVARLDLARGAWEKLADVAAATGMSTARYAGEVLEATARDLGWRARL